MPPDLLCAEVCSGRASANFADPVPWWSFGKTVLAASALALVEQGRLALDDPIPPYGITLRQTLQHRAGLPDYGELPDYHADVARRDAAWPLAEMLVRAGMDQPKSAGNVFRYSNIGYTLIGAWIKAAAGALLGPALEALALRPLRIEGVQLAETQSNLENVWGVAPGYDPAWVYPGLLIGPPASAALFLHRLLAGELLAPATMAVMREPLPAAGQIPGRPWASANYGMGLMIATTGAPGILTGHTGAGPGSACAVYQARPDRTVAVFARDEHPVRVELEAAARALKDA